MQPSAPAPGTDSAHAAAGPSGLTPEHKAAMRDAFEKLDMGHTEEEAVDHLVSKDMPRVVAKVLVKQYNRRKGNPAT